MSEAGVVKKENEDAFLIADLERGVLRLANREVLVCEPSPRGLLVAVADGMSGVKGGAIASRLALETLLVTLRERTTTGVRTAKLEQAIRIADRKILAAAREDARLEGMGTTLTGALLSGTQLRVAHVGDSRAYLVRSGAITQLTTDHTVAEKVRGLSPVEAKESPQAHVLAQAVGGARGDVAVEQVSLDLCDGDQFLLCSDGLHDVVSSPEILEVLADVRDPAIACSKLVERAAAGGTEDNITVLVAGFSRVALAEPRPGAPLVLRDRVEVTFNQKTMKLRARRVRPRASRVGPWKTRLGVLTSEIAAPGRALWNRPWRVAAGLALTVLFAWLLVQGGRLGIARARGGPLELIPIIVESSDKEAYITMVAGRPPGLRGRGELRSTVAAGGRYRLDIRFDSATRMGAPPDVSLVLIPSGGADGEFVIRVERTSARLRSQDSVGGQRRPPEDSTVRAETRRSNGGVWSVPR